MNLRQLTYFCEIVKSGSAAHAATTLFVSPTSITMQISQLEQELGGSLFDRSRRPMELTTLGRHFYPRAQELLTSAKQLEKETKGLAAGQRGWLAVGFVRSSLFSILPKTVRQFRQTHPEIQLELIPMQSEAQPQELLSGRIQIGISRFLGEYNKVDGLQYWDILDDPFMVALPEAHPLAGRKNVRADELDIIPYITFPRVPQSHYAEDTLAILRDAGGSPMTTYRADEIYVALAMVAAGMGFCLVGRSVARSNREDVKFVNLTGAGKPAQIVAVAREQELVKSVTAFLEALRVTVGR